MNGLLIQPFDQAVVNVVDEDLHLLSKAYVKRLFPDAAALLIAGAVGFPDVLQIVRLSKTRQSILGAFQPDLGPSPAQFPIVQQQRLPQVEGYSGYFWQCGLSFLIGGVFTTEDTENLNIWLNCLPI